MPGPPPPPRKRKSSARPPEPEPWHNTKAEKASPGDRLPYPPHAQRLFHLSSDNGGRISRGHFETLKELEEFLAYAAQRKRRGGT